MLIQLPEEILHIIISYLDVKSSIALTCHKLYLTSQYLRFAFFRNGKKIPTNLPIIGISNSLLQNTENLNVRFLIIDKYLCKPALTFQYTNTDFFINSSLLVPTKKYSIYEFSKRIKLFSTPQSCITNTLLTNWNWVSISTSHLEGLDYELLSKVERITIDKLPYRIERLPISLNIVVVHSRIFYNCVPFSHLRMIPTLEIIIMCSKSRFYLRDLEQFSNIVPHISYFKHPCEFFAPYVRVLQPFKIILKNTPKWVKYLDSFRV